MAHQFGNFTVLVDQSSTLISHQIEIINNRRKSSGDTHINVDSYMLKIKDNMPLNMYIHIQYITEIIDIDIAAYILHITYLVH